MLNEHVFLIGNSDSGLGALSVALSGGEHTLELINIDLLLGSVLLSKVELVVVELKSWGSSPFVSVVAIDSCKFAHISEGILLGCLIVSVLDLVEVCVPT